MTSNELLALRDVVAGYTRPVVGPVSLAVSPGQILGLGGHNGAGKSTILRSITGMACLFSGTIQRADGVTIAHQWQRPELPPELALLGRELYALLGADPAWAPTIIRPLLGRPLYRLSGGQFQLLQTLACLCSPAQLVLMDEPTNNLDGRALETLSALLQEIKAPRAVVLVSHERAFLEAHCTDWIEVGP